MRVNVCILWLCGIRGRHNRLSFCGIYVYMLVIVGTACVAVVSSVAASVMSSNIKYVISFLLEHYFAALKWERERGRGRKREKKRERGGGREREWQGVCMCGWCTVRVSGWVVKLGIYTFISDESLFYSLPIHPSPPSLSMPQVVYKMKLLSLIW